MGQPEIHPFARKLQQAVDDLAGPASSGCIVRTIRESAGKDGANCSPARLLRDGVTAYTAVLMCDSHDPENGDHWERAAAELSPKIEKNLRDLRTVRDRFIGWVITQTPPGTFSADHLRGLVLRGERLLESMLSAIGEARAVSPDQAPARRFYCRTPTEVWQGIAEEWRQVVNELVSVENVVRFVRHMAPQNEPTQIHELMADIRQVVAEFMSGPAPHRPRDEGPPAPAIWYHGRQSYSLNGAHPQYAVTKEEHDVLQLFLDEGLAMLGPELEDRGITNPSRTITGLAEGYDEVFKPAIRLPKGRGCGGYYITVQSALKVPADVRIQA